MKVNQTDLYLFLLFQRLSQHSRIVPGFDIVETVFFPLLLPFLPQVQKQMGITRQRASPPPPRRVCRRALKIAPDTKRNSGISRRDERVVVVPAQCAGIDRRMDGWMGGEGVSRMAGWIREGGVCVKWKVKSASYVMWEEGGGRWIIASSSPHPSKNTSFCHWIFVRSVMLHHRRCFFFLRMKDKSSQLSPEKNRRSILPEKVVTDPRGKSWVRDVQDMWEKCATFIYNHEINTQTFNDMWKVY